MKSLNKRKQNLSTAGQIINACVCSRQHACACSSTYDIKLTTDLALYNISMNTGNMIDPTSV